MDATNRNGEVAGSTHQQQLPYHLATPRDVQTQSALEPWPTQAHVEPVTSVAIPQPTALAQQPNNGENLLFMCAVEEQKQLRFEDVEVEHRVDETSETLDVNVVRGSVEESRRAFFGAHVNEKGEVEVCEWVVSSYAVFVEQLSFQVRKTWNDSPYKAIAGGPGREYEPSETEKCCDCLCQAYTCNNLSGLAKLARRDRSEQPTISKIESFATENLRKARALGIKAMTQVLWTPYTKALVGAYVRDFSIYVFFLLSFAMWITALVGFVNGRVEHDDKDDTYNLVKLIFSSIGLLFGTVDLVHHTCTNRFTTCEECGHCVSEVHQRYRPDAEAGNECCTCCNKAQKHCNSCIARYQCCKFPKRCATVLDTIRLLFLEMMVYPNLLFSVFHVIVQVVEVDGKVEATTIISMILSMLLSFFTIYVARWFVLAGTIFSIQKIRTGDAKLTARSLVDTSSAKFHLAFVLNAIGHTVVQMLMIIAIGARFYDEYTNDAAYLPSAKLWFMMLIGYIGPFVGVIMFLITCHFWTQQFPIQFFLDYLKILKKPGIGDIFKRKKVAEKHHDTFQKLGSYLDEGTLLQEFNNVKHKDLTTKLTYPFFSPVHVILCLVYCGFLLAFGLCAVVDGILSPGWVAFYVLATIFAIFVNGYACAITLLWVAIIVAVLAVIVLIVALIFFLCCVLSSGSDNSRQRNY